MHDGLVAWLRAAAARIHEEAPAPDRARPGDRRRRPRDQHGPRVRGDRREARRATDAGGPERPMGGDGRPPPARRADPDQHGRRRIRAAVRHGVPAGAARSPAATEPVVRRRRSSPPSRPLRPGSRALGKATTGEKTMLDALCAGGRGGPCRARRRRRRSPRSSPPPATPPTPARPPRSRCSRPRAGPRTSASGASVTRIPARHRRRCSSASSPASIAASD